MGFKLSQVQAAPLEPIDSVIAPKQDTPGQPEAASWATPGQKYLDDLPIPKDDVEARDINTIIGAARGLPALKKLSPKSVPLSKVTARKLDSDKPKDFETEIADAVYQARERRQQIREAGGDPYERPEDGSMISSEAIRDMAEYIPFADWVDSNIKGAKAHEAWDKIENPEKYGKFSPDDIGFIAREIIREEAKAEQASERGILSKAGHVAATLPKNAYEWYTMVGAGSGLKAPVGLLAREGFKKFITRVGAKVTEQAARKALLKQSVGFAGKAVGVAARGAAFAAPGIVGDTMTGTLKEVDDQGKMVEGDSVAGAAARSFAGRTIENLTEFMGGLTPTPVARTVRAAIPAPIEKFLINMSSRTGKLAAKASARLSKVPGAATAKAMTMNVGGKLMKPVEMISGLHKYANKYVTGKYRSYTPDAVKRAMKGASWHGLISESLEERYGEAMRAALDSLGFEMGDSSQYVNNQLYSAAKNYFAGNPAEAWNQLSQGLSQLAAEGFGFLPYQGAAVAANIYGQQKQLNRSMAFLKMKKEAMSFNREMKRDQARADAHAKEVEKATEAVRESVKQNGDGFAFLGPEGDIFAAEDGALVHYDSNGNRTGDVYAIDSAPKEILEKLADYELKQPRTSEEIEADLAKISEGAQAGDVSPQEFAEKYERLNRELDKAVQRESAADEVNATADSIDVPDSPEELKEYEDDQPEAPQTSTPQPEATKPEAKPAEQQPVAMAPVDVESEPASESKPATAEGLHAPGTKVKVKSGSGKDYGENEIAGYETVDGKTKVVFKKPLPTGADRSFIEGVNLSPIGDKVEEPKAPESVSPAQPKAEVPPAQQAKPANEKKEEVTRQAEDKSAAEPEAPKKRSMNDRPGKVVGKSGQTAIPDLEDAAREAEQRDEIVSRYESASGSGKLPAESRKKVLEAVANARSRIEKLHKILNARRPEAFGIIRELVENELAYGKDLVGVDDLTKIVGEDGEEVGDLRLEAAVKSIVESAADGHSFEELPLAEQEKARRLLIAIEAFDGDLNRKAIERLQDIISDVYRQAAKVVQDLDTGELGYEGSKWDAAIYEIDDYLNNFYEFDENDTITGDKISLGQNKKSREAMTQDAVMQASTDYYKEKNKTSGPVFTEPEDRKPEAVKEETAAEKLRRKLGERLKGEAPKAEPAESKKPDEPAKPKAEKPKADAPQKPKASKPKTDKPQADKPKAEPKPAPKSTGDSAVDDVLARLRAKKEGLKSYVPVPTGMKLHDSGGWFEYMDMYVLARARAKGSHLTVETGKDGKETWRLRGPNGTLEITEGEWTTFGELFAKLNKFGMVPGYAAELADIVLKDTPVVLTKRGSDNNKIEDGAYRGLWMADSTTGKILMTTSALVSPSAFVATLIHEAIHGKTAHAISFVMDDPDFMFGRRSFVGWNDLTDEELFEKYTGLKNAVSDLLEVYSEALKALLDEHPGVSNIPGVIAPGGGRWAANVYEFASEAVANGDLQRWLATKNFKSKNGKGLVKNLLAKLINALNRILGLNPGQETLLSNALRSIGEIMEEEKKWQRAGIKRREYSLANRDPRKLNFKDVTKRVEQLTKGAQELRAGKINKEQYDELVNTHKPVYPYESVPAAEPIDRIKEVIGAKGDGKVGAVLDSLPDGSPVKVRLDIPAYRDHGVWVVTVHPGTKKGEGGSAGTSLGYGSYAVVSNPKLGIDQDKSLLIAAEEMRKNPIATIGGFWSKVTESEAIAEAQEALKIANEDAGKENPRWAQVGMDPERHSYFYDRHTTQPIISGEKAIQIGPLVLVKAPNYGKKSDFLYSKDNDKLDPDIADLVIELAVSAITSEKLAIRDFGDYVRLAREQLGDEFTMQIASAIERSWDESALILGGEITLTGTGGSVLDIMELQDKFNKDKSDVPEEDSSDEGEPGVPDGSEESDADAAQEDDGDAPGRDPGRVSNEEGEGLPGDPGATPEGDAVSDGPGEGGDSSVGTPPSDQPGMADGEQARPGAEEAPKEVSESLVNHVIEDGDVIVAPTEKQRYADNVAAIELLKQLESENRLPTKEEKKVLARFSGWGGLKPYFDTIKSEYPRWKENIPWAEKYLEGYSKIRSLLTDSEWDAAVASTENAHYTEVGVTKKLWEIAARLGFKGGRYLEPGAGIGNFAGLMPGIMRPSSKGYMVEMDEVSSRMLRKLYPENEILAGDFAKIGIVPHSMDFVIGNVPFAGDVPADARVRYGIDLNLHNYFIARSIDAVKPGGIVVVISSHSTMDNNPQQSEFLNSRADLIGAIRLPSNAFMENAKTAVTTDILIFRKPLSSIEPRSNPSWTRGYRVKGKTSTGIDKEGRISAYFEEHPEMVLGKHSFTGKMYRPDSYEVLAEPGTNLLEKLDEAIKNLPEDILSEKSAAGEAVEREYDGPPEGTIQVIGDKLHVVYKRTSTEIVPGRSSKIEGYPAKLFSAAAQSVGKSYVALRDAFRSAVSVMMDPASTEKDVQDAQRELDRQYESFIGTHGYLNANKSMPAFESDPDFYKILSIENVKAAWNPDINALEYSYSKGDIFTKRVLGPKTPPVSVASVEDGIHVSMAYKGDVDIGYVASLVGITEEEAARQVIEKNVAFRDPVSGLYVPNDLYLSGNVRQKLLEAEVAAKDSPEYNRNVEALKEAQPKRVSLKGISFRLGSPWIPPEVFQEFADYMLLGSHERGLITKRKKGKRYAGRNVTVRYLPETNSYSVKWTGGDKADASKGVRTDLSVEKMNGRVVSAVELLEYALNLNYTPRLTVTQTNDDGKQISVHDVNASIKAAQVIERMANAFQEFVKTPGSEFGEMVEEAYNTSCNHTVETKHNGAGLTLPGASSEISLRPYQKNAILRFIRDGFGLLAHAVGAGKTYTLIATAMEMKRLGLAKRPVIVVQNATLGQFSTSFMKMYPGANVLVATSEDLGAGRHQFLARMTTGNWDAIVMAQSTFDMIAVTPEAEKAGLQEELDALDEILRYYYEEGDDARTPRVRDVNKAIKAIRKRYDRIEAERRQKKEEEAKTGKRAKERIVWEELGVDALLVDEAHAYKKPPFVTKLGQIVGLQKQVSEVGRAIMLKVRQVQSRSNGRNIIFATGTPVTNTLGEIWHMMNFVAPNKNREFGVQTFDHFVGKFAINGQVLEANAAGEPVPKEALHRFTNGPEFMSWLRTGLDILTPDELREFITEVDKDGNPLRSMIPGMRGGAINKIVVPASPYVAEFKDYILECYDYFKGLEGDMKRFFSWVPVQLFSAGKYIAMDARLLYPNAKEVPGGKIDSVVSHALEEYRASTERKGTQLIFSDLFNARNLGRLNQFYPNENLPEQEENEEDAKKTGDEKGAWLFQEIKRKLIKNGVPEEQIAIVADYEKEDREALFDRVKSGEIRFIMGSTESLGTGVNCQNKVTAIHHVDVPWMPSALEQRNGRGLRYGNENFDKGVAVYMYATEETLDSALLTKVVRKAKGIHQVLGGRLEGREFDDPTSEVSLSLEELAAIAEGNVNFFKKIELEKAIRELEMARDSIISSQTRAREYRKQALESIAEMERSNKSGGEVVEKLKEVAAKKPANIKIGDKEYDLSKKEDEAQAQEALDVMMRELRHKVEAQTSMGSMPLFAPDELNLWKASPGQRSAVFNINGLEARYIYGVYLVENVNGVKKAHGSGRFMITLPDDTRNLYRGEAKTVKGLFNATNELQGQIEGRIEQNTRDIENRRAEIDDSAAILSKTWDREGEIEAKKNELRDVQDALLKEAEDKAAARAARRKAKEDAANGPMMSSRVQGGKRRLGAKKVAGGLVNNLPQNMNPAPYSGDQALDVAQASVIARWSDMFKVKLLSGGYREKAQGIYKWWLKKNQGSGVARFKAAHFDIYTAAHEIAHHIDMLKDVGVTANLRSDAMSGVAYDQHGRVAKPGVAIKYTAMDVLNDIVKVLKHTGYQPGGGLDLQAAEGWAEFIRLYLTESNLPVVAGTAYDWFTTTWAEDHKELFEQLTKARKLAQEYVNQGVLQRARSVFQPINLDQPINEWWENKIKSTYTSWMENYVDKNWLFKKIDERLSEAGWDPIKSGAAKLWDMVVGYSMTGRARAAASLELGVFSVRVGSEKMLGQAGGYWQGIKDNIKDDLEYGEAISYAHARHTIYMHDVRGADFNTGMHIDLARETVAAISKDPAKAARYELAARHIARYANDQLNILVDAGAMSAKDRDNMVKYYGDYYFPLHRQQRPEYSMFGTKERRESAGEGQKMVNLGKPVKRRSLKGSEAPLYDPSVAIMERAVRFYDRAAKTRVIHALVGRLDPMEGGVSRMGDLIDRIPPGRRLTTAKLGELLKQLVDEKVIDVKKARLMLIAHKFLKTGAMNKKDKSFFRKALKIPKGAKKSVYVAKAKDLPRIEAEISIWRNDYTPSAAKATVLVHDTKGRPVMYQVDRYLYDLLMGMDEPMAGAFAKLAGNAAALFRAGAINLNPAFAFFNPSADMPNYLVTGKDSPWYNRMFAPFCAVLGVTTAKAHNVPVIGKTVSLFAHAVTAIVNRARAIAGMPGIEGTNLQMVRNPNDVVIRYYELLGGGLFTPVGGNYRSHEATVRRKLFHVKHSKKGLIENLTEKLDDAAYSAGTVLSGIQSAIAVTDMYPRLAQFEATMNAHGYYAKGDHWEDSSGAVAIPPEHVQISAIVAAGNSTTNFKVHGKVGRKINILMPLWNPAMQGTYRWLRLVGNLKNLKSGDDEARLLAQRTMYMMLASFVTGCFNWLSRHNDSDYQNQSPDVKEKWFTMGYGGKTIMKLAKKPMDHNGMIMNIAEAGLDAIFHSDKGNRVGEVIYNFLLDSIPTGGGFIRTTAETFFDYDLWRKRTIVPNYLAKTTKRYQFTEYTLETSKVISNMLGNTISPVKVDHFMNGVTGGLYRRLGDTAETVLSGNLPRLNQLPLLRGMLPDRHATEPINKLYDRSAKLDDLIQLPWSTRAQKAEKVRLDQYTELMHDIRALELQKGGKRSFEYQKYLVGLANEAMRYAPQKDNPAPYGDDVPKEVKKVIFDFAMRKAKIAMMLSDHPRKAEPGKTLEETLDHYHMREQIASTWLGEHSNSEPVFAAMQQIRKSQGFKDLIDRKGEPKDSDERRIWDKKRDRARYWK